MNSIITTKQLLVAWNNLLKDKNSSSKPQHFNLGKYEFIGTITNYKFNGIMIDHYTEKQYKIKDLYPSFIYEKLELKEKMEN